MEAILEQLNHSFQNLSLKIGEWVNQIILNLPNFVLALLVGAAGYYLSKFIRKIAVKSTAKITNNKTILNLVSNLSAVLFTIIILFLILSIFNLGGTINKILATAGVLGLAVGLALQDPMNNLFSGVFMSVRELYKIGDLVETNGYFGTIQNIDLRATILKLPTGQEVMIPNKEVVQNPLTNFSISGERRVDISCGISYGDDLNKVEKIVLEAFQGLSGIKKEKPIDIVFTEFGDSSINFKARFWVQSGNQTDYLHFQSNAIKAIKNAFDQNDIMIPFPIRTLDFGIKGGVALSKQISLNSQATK